MEGLIENARGRTVVLGVGHALRADDAVGSVVAQSLRPRHPDRVFDGGQAPENFLGPIRRAAPDVVVIVDAADFGASPGEVRVASADDVLGEMTATHAAPLSMLMKLLSQETGADVRLVAVQSKSTALGGTMCAEVAEAARRVASELEGLLEEGSPND